jgi:hypothetical protein
MALKIGWLHEAEQSLGTWLHEADDWHIQERLLLTDEMGVVREHHAREQANKHRFQASDHHCVWASVEI